MDTLKALTNWRLWIGVAVSAVSIVLVLRQVDLTLVAHNVVASDPIFLVILVASVPATLWMKAARWKLFFAPADPVTTRGLFSAIYIGYMVSVIVPLRAGELVRVFLVANQERLPWSRVLATVIVEKVLDVLAVAALLLVVAALVPLPEWAVAGAQVVLLLTVVGLAVLASLFLMESSLLRLFARVETSLPPLKRLQLGSLLGSFNQGFGFIRTPRTLARVAAWTVVIWVAAGVTIWAGLVGTNVIASPGSIGFVLSLTNLGMVVPSAPGYVGYYHSLVVASLGAFGVDPNQALGTALVLHGVTFGTILVGGLLYLWRGQYSIGSLLTSSQRSAATAHPAPEQPLEVRVGEGGYPGKSPSAGR